MIDDDTINNKIISNHLKNTSYYLTTIADPTVAWEHLLQAPHEYQIILLDRMMFAIDGIELLQRIKQHPDLKHLIVIMISAEIESEEYNDILQAGAADFILKPISKENLLTALVNAYASIF